MTPQERQLVNELLDRLASLEGTPRDPEADRLIAEGLARAPHAAYPLVQTVLLQDEALKRANARIAELEGGAPPQEGRGFLDSMRDAVLGRDDTRRGSVPSVSQSKWGSGQAAASAYGTQPGAQPQPEPQRGGGSSFLGTAAAAAAGVIGGSLLLNGIQSLMGGHQGQAAAAPFGSSERQTPWGDDASRSDLAREAGVNDISGGRGGGDAQRSSLFDNNQDADSNAGDFDVADLGDFGGGDGGGGGDA
jgi:uncharacterized protein